MKSLNRVELIGHVGADPEIRTTSGGTSVASLRLATNRKSRDEEITDWHRLTFWDQLAGLVEQYVRKGDPPGSRARSDTQRLGRTVRSDSGRRSPFRG